VDEALSNLLLKALGHRIRELRTEQGYSQEAFADKCGVHRTFMGTVERGESNLSFSNIAKVAATLGISLSVLFRDLEEHGPDPLVEKTRSQPTKRKATPRPKA
jgi:transcriptional regulator with XRE-family HTH domain